VDADLLIPSAAVGPDNPELVRATERGIPIVDYPRMLGRLSRGRPTLAVAGTHGKSTTVAMIAAILEAAGPGPTVIGGATPLGLRSGGRLGAADALVVEACEYREHFLHLHPRVAVLLPIEPDHFDCFPDARALEAAFGRFVTRLPTDGRLLIAADCPRVRAVARHARCPVTTFGVAADADVSARSIRHDRGRYRFALHCAGQAVADVALGVPGRHNVQNALAAIAAAQAFSGWESENHSSISSSALAVSRFSGLHRRLEDRGVHDGVRWIDDYAHHPTELRAALATIAKQYPDARVTCVFQPHQASRTAALFDEFVAALGMADRVAVADVFRAREGPPQPEDVDAARLAKAVRDAGPEVADVHHSEAIAAWLAQSLLPGDILLTAGAGDVDRVAPRWRAIAATPRLVSHAAGP
jgi:UDP-N-acetylmuramate--alanine ligase